MHRFVLTDAQWTKMAPLCLGKARHPGRTGGDGRSFLEALLRSARGGRPWRDLPPLFGPWNGVFKGSRDWAKADVFKRLSDAVPDHPEMHPSSRAAATHRGQKGDVKSGHGPLQGWAAPRAA
jgi:transposase